MGRKSQSGQPTLTPDEVSSIEAEDAELFRRAMYGTTQLKNDKPRITKSITTTAKIVSEQQPAHSPAAPPTPPKVTTCQPLDSAEHESQPHMPQGCAPGVNRALLQQLQQGHITFVRQLDLHGYTHDRAHQTLIKFLEQARFAGVRCVLVITGYGKQSPLGISVLRQALPTWLTSAPLNTQVLAYCPAKRIHGGPGAFYVLMRSVKI